MRFRVAVRPDIWNDPAVNRTLADALAFLSEDESASSSLHSASRWACKHRWALPTRKPGPTSSDEVILDSGGLELAGQVYEDVIGRGRRAVLVDTAARPRSLIGRMRWRSKFRGALPDSFFSTLSGVRKGEREPIEHTQRLRAFLFATLGVAIAQMFGREVVQFFENGITSFNFPISEHVIGTWASRTTHPRVLARFSRFFSTLLELEHSALVPGPVGYESRGRRSDRGTRMR